MPQPRVPQHAAPVASVLKPPTAKEFDHHREMRSLQAHHVFEKKTIIFNMEQQYQHDAKLIAQKHQEQLEEIKATHEENMNAAHNKNQAKQNRAIARFKKLFQDQEKIREDDVKELTDDVQELRQKYRRSRSQQQPKGTENSSTVDDSLNVTGFDLSSYD